MRGRRSLIAAAVVVTALGVGAAAVAFAAPRLWPALGADVTDQTFGTFRNQVGDVRSFGLKPFGPRGSGTVKIRSVRLTGLPDGLELVSIQAAQTPESPGLGIGDGHPENHPEYHLHPVSDMRFTPGQPERWYLIVVVRLTKPGIWRSEGIAVSWERGFVRGTTTLPYRVRMTTETTAQGK